MAVTFAQKGEEASLLCLDASCSYFVVHGSLLPVVDTSEQATPPAFVAGPILQSSSRSALRQAYPDEEAAVATEAKHSPQSTRPGAPKGGPRQGLPYRVACGVEGLPVPACCSWTFSCDDGSSSAGASAWTCATPTKHSDLMGLIENGSGAIKSVASKRRTPATAGTPPPSSPEARIAAPNAGAAAPIAEIAQDTKRMEGRPILPGQSLDQYLLPMPPGEAEETDPEGEKRKCPEAFPAKPEGSFGNETAPRRWRLEARDGVCVGRVSRRFLRELELEEPKHHVEVKVAFLRRTEVSGENTTRFSPFKTQRSRAAVPLTLNLANSLLLVPVSVPAPATLPTSCSIFRALKRSAVPRIFETGSFLLVLSESFRASSWWFGTAALSGPTH